MIMNHWLCQMTHEPHVGQRIPACCCCVTLTLLVCHIFMGLGEHMEVRLEWDDWCWMSLWWAKGSPLSWPCNRVSLSTQLFLGSRRFTLGGPGEMFLVFMKCSTWWDSEARAFWTTADRLPCTRLPGLSDVKWKLGLCDPEVWDVRDREVVWWTWSWLEEEIYLNVHCMYMKQWKWQQYESYYHL